MFSNNFASFCWQVKVLGHELRCGFRRAGSLVQLRHCKGNFDIATRLKSMLIRRDLYKHLAGIFRNFERDILAFLDPDWYLPFAGSEEAAEGAVDAPEDGNDDGCKVEVSAYTAKIPLMKFCTKLAKGHYELSLCKVAILGLGLSLFF